MKLSHQIELFALFKRFLNTSILILAALMTIKSIMLIKQCVKEHFKELLSSRR